MHDHDLGPIVAKNVPSRGKRPNALVAVAIVLAALAIIFGTLAAGAEEKKPLTVAEALSLLQALRNLDGRIVVVKNGANESTVTLPWEFGSGTLRLRIARNVSALAGVERSLEEARQKIVAEILQKMPSKDATASIAPGSPEFAAFSRQVSEALAAPAPVDLARIKASELRLDKNEIPVTALSALAPILDDDVTK